MIYRIIHKTAYRYSEPASLSQNELFLHPRGTGTQRVVQSRLAIASRSVSKQVMQYLLDNGIGRTSQNIYMFSNSDRIKLAILALKNGNDVELISKILTWRDFEVLTSEILNLSGYKNECCGVNRD